MHLLSDNPALRSQLESQVDFMTEFTEKAIGTLRQLSELNLKLARQTIEGSLYASRELMSCTDPAQLLQTAIRQVQPAGERVRAYQHHLFGVLAGAQADIGHTAATRLPEASRNASATAGEMARQAAPGANVPLGAAAPAAGVSPSTGNGSAQHH